MPQTQTWTKDFGDFRYQVKWTQTDKGEIQLAVLDRHLSRNVIETPTGFTNLIHAKSFATTHIDKALGLDWRKP